MMQYIYIYILKKSRPLGGENVRDRERKSGEFSLFIVNLTL